jgi:hypothetical protein
LQAELKAIIDGREDSIEQGRVETVAHFEAQLATMRDTLESTKSSMEAERTAFEANTAEKLKQRKERLAEIIQEREQAIQLLQDEIESVKQETENTRKDWEEQIAEINASYDKGLQDISAREHKEDRYFEAKLTALKEELARVVKENEAMAAAVPDYDDKDFLREAQDSFAMQELQLTERISQEMEQQIESRVNERMKEMREQHRQERAKLLQEALQLEERETILQSGGETGSEGFLSPEYITACQEPWRGNYFPDTKHLKQEEAVALKELDDKKQEFKEALGKTAGLRRKLEEAAAKYEADLAEATAKGGEEIGRLREVVAQKEKEVLMLERQFEESEMEVRRRFHEIDDAETQLKSLRMKLADEKLRIKEKIQQEYQPLITAEKTKSEKLAEQLENLRRELELALEYLRHDLFDIETSNAAMEESLRAETEKLIEDLRAELELEYQRQEAELLDGINTTEKEAYRKMMEEKRNLEDAMAEMKRTKEEQIAREQAEFDERIAELNNECVEIMTANVELKEKIKFQSECECQTCPLLDRNIRKLEKLLVKMQIQDRDLVLDGQNKKDMIHKLHVKPKLPPLPGKPL